MLPTSVTPRRIVSRSTHHTCARSREPYSPAGAGQTPRRRSLEEADERHGNPARVDEEPAADLDPLDHHDHGDRAEQEPEDELARESALGLMGWEPAADGGGDEGGGG